MNYYNENDKYCAQWLRNLVDAAFIPDGDVDERSIVDVSAAEVRGYTQCHFFAGIGGWSYALRLAGWPEDRAIWTGSCPCQSFSVAGQRKGTADARHLWPDFHRLIREVRPVALAGEQVGGTLGYAWLDGVCDDLAEEGYRCDAIDIPACSVGAPHIRQRIYWVAHPGHARMRGTAGAGEEESGRALGEVAGCGDGSASGGVAESQKQRLAIGLTGVYGNQRQAESYDQSLAGGLGHPNSSRPQGRRQHSGEHADQWVTREAGQPGRLDHANGKRTQRPGGEEYILDAGSKAGGMGQSESQQMGNAGLAWGRSDAADNGLGYAESERRREAGRSGERSEERPADTEPAGYWSDYAIVHCTDGKARRIEPGTFPLVDELSYRVDSPGPLAGKSRQKVLKGYGNAIVPELAAEVIRAWMETMPQ